MNYTSAAYQSILDSIKVIPLIEKQIDDDSAALNSFKEELLLKKWNMVCRYKKAKEEIEELLDKDDGKSVERYITALVQVDSRIVKIQGLLDDSADYCDRHNKSKVVNWCTINIEEVYDSMCLSEVKKYMEKLDDVEKAIQEVLDSFHEEHKELMSIKRRLKKKTSNEMWKEDRDRILDAIDAVLANDVRKMDFDLDELKAEMEKMMATRQKDLQDTLSKYTWLDKAEFQESVSKCLSRAEFQSWLDTIVCDRNFNRIMVCFVLLMFILFGVSAICFEIYE